MKQRAFARGFDPARNPQVLEEYVKDGHRSGRPKEISITTESELLKSVRKDHSGREKSADFLAYERNISCSSALRILHKNSLRNVKPTRKPGLNTQQRAARLAFALEHYDWTLEDWKRVIWSDETSVILGQRRGAVRLWRGSDEIYSITVIRRRWKDFSEFMFWGCFSWNRKGPYHIWQRETAKEREEVEKELEELNTTLESTLRTEWEFSQDIKRTNLRRRPADTKSQ
ncbi:MAG: hypothetical protein HC869_05015 [Rhodospirillales bacterium]|nr:hypothetical protein [Rhodospirillales bacterium]